MSNFLSQFEEKKYKKDDEIEDLSKSIKKDIKEIIEEEEEVERPRRRVVDVVDHDTEIDTKYNKRRMVLYVSIAAAAIIITIIVITVIMLANRVTVKSFVGSNVSEARTWGVKNNIELEIESIFDLENAENIVISQDKESGKKIQKGSILKLTVSKGADPDELIVFPEFSKMDMSEIQTWINTTKLRNVYISMEFNAEIERNGFIKYEFRKDTVNETNFTRKDSMTIYVSRGEEVLEKNIEVPDFKDKTRMEVENWAKTNSVQVKYTESGSESVMEGLVISQSIAAGTKIDKTQTMTVTISKGKGVKVPDFSKISKDEAFSFPGLQVNLKKQYSTSVPFGKLISQSIKSGTMLYGEDRNIQVIYSEGRPYMDDITGMSEKDLAAYFYEFSSKGANITYVVEYVDSHEKKGAVVWTSKADEFINMTEEIIVHVSKGNIGEPHEE